MMLQRIFRAKRISAAEFSLFEFRYTRQFSQIKENHCLYPPIIDMSDEGQKRHFRQMWYDSVRALPSVEQKLLEMAIQQKTNLKTYTLSAVSPTYTGVDFQKYITRTHVINSLPKQLMNMNVDNELNEIRDVLCDVLLNYYCNFWGENKTKEFIMENESGSKLVNSLILQCYKKLAVKNDYILQSTIQQNPRIFSFWWHGGYETEKEKERDESLSLQWHDGYRTGEDKVHEKNLCFQFEDYASLAIRVKHPLLPILDMNDPLCSTAEVIDYHYHPDVFQIPSSEISKVASVPGFWPGDPCEFPFLLVYTSDKLRSLTSVLEKYDLNKIEESVGVMTSFAWLNAVSTHQGFTPFHDITYPFVTQTILTNGQDWNFFVYQLNTTAFHNDVDKKDRRNICWSSGKLRLFDTIEDGHIKGINDEVFKVLLKFLHNAPQKSDYVVLNPYLGEDLRTTDEKANLRYLLRNIYSRRPDHMAHLEEIPTWVKIYKLHPDAPPSPFIKLE